MKSVKENPNEINKLQTEIDWRDEIKNKTPQM